MLVALNGLHPPSMGARLSFPAGKPRVNDGPFPEAKEVIGGFWIIDVGSKQEAVEWATRCPMTPDELIEIRQVQHYEDFTPAIRKVVAAHPELRTKLGMDEDG